LTSFSPSLEVGNVIVRKNITTSYLQLGYDEREQMN
jgi:hypothetical protein